MLIDFANAVINRPDMKDALASGTISILLLLKEFYPEPKPIIYKVGVLKLGRDQAYFGEPLGNAPDRIEELSQIPFEEELPLIQNIKMDIEQGLLYSHAVWWLSEPYSSTKVGTHT